MHVFYSSQSETGGGVAWQSKAAFHRERRQEVSSHQVGVWCNGSQFADERLVGLLAKGTDDIAVTAQQQW